MPVIFVHRTWEGTEYTALTHIGVWVNKKSKKWIRMYSMCTCAYSCVQENDFRRQMMKSSNFSLYWKIGFTDKTIKYFSFSFMFTRENRISCCKLLLYRRLNDNNHAHKLHKVPNVTTVYLTLLWKRLYYRDEISGHELFFVCLYLLKCRRLWFEIPSRN